MISLSRIILDLVLDGLEIPILRETFPRRVLIDFNLMKPYCPGKSGLKPYSVTAPLLPFVYFTE